MSISGIGQPQNIDPREFQESDAGPGETQTRIHQRWTFHILHVNVSEILYIRVIIYSFLYIDLRTSWPRSPKYRECFLGFGYN